MVADSHHFVDERDPDSDPHQTNNSEPNPEPHQCEPRTHIRIRVKEIYLVFSSVVEPEPEP
jgi:hypothetical protein